jgi:hypothetical protein
MKESGKAQTNPEAITVRQEIAAEQPGDVSALTCDRLLSALDAEIKFVAGAQSNEGWTRWAIWGALGALAWIATELIADEDLSMSRAAFLAISFFVVWSLAETVVGVLSPSARMHAGVPRFRLLTDFIGTLRPELTASGLRQCLVLAGLVYFQFTGLWPLWLYATVSLCTLVLVFVCGMTSMALPTNINLGAAFNITTGIQIAALAIICAMLVPSIQNDWGNYSLEEVRLALILNAGSYLLIRLATATSSEHLLSQLTQLRQHLAFGRMSVSDANQRAESLLTGLKLSDVLHPLAEAVRTEVDSLKPQIGAYEKAINELESKLVDVRGVALSEAQKNALFAEALRRIDALDQQFAEISRESRGVRKARSRYDWSAIVIFVYSPASRREAKEFAERVRNEHLAAIKILDECHQKHVRQKNEVNQLNRNSQFLAINS